MRNTNVKNENGITLIVLVITVVILFILSLLVVDFTVDGKLFKTANELGAKGEAQQTETETLRNSWKDMLGLTNTTGGDTTCEHTSTTAKDNGDGTHTITCTNCGKQITTEKHNYVNQKCTKCGAQKLAVAGEKTTETLEFTDSDGNKAIIPKGFTVSKADDEKTIEKGLVIYLINDKTEEEIKNLTWSGTTLENLKKSYDQFVWIPVANVNSMFMCQSKAANEECNIKLVNEIPTCTNHSNSTAMAGRLYATGIRENFNSSLTTQTYNANSGLREPAIVTGKVDGTGTSYDGSGSNDIGLTLTTLQEEYNNAVKKVIESKGFWIGRYETSGMNSSNNDIAENIVAGKGTSDGINNIIWYGMYKQQQNYVSKKNLDTSKIQSTMVFGAAYDQTMIFANCAEKTTQIKDYPTAVITGNVETDCYKNIYDLCGNLSELTTEAYSTSSRVYRGGNYSTSLSASDRNDRNPTISDNYRGIRYQSHTLRNAVSLQTTN